MLTQLFFTVVFMLTMHSQLLAQSDNSVAKTFAPWDTVLAEIQIVEQINAVDTLKSQLLKDIFDRFQVTAQDYKNFYNNFMKKPLKFKQAFLDRVKSILIAQGKKPKRIKK